MGEYRKPWKEYNDDDMKVRGFHTYWAVFRDVWSDLIGPICKRLTIA